MLEGTKSEGKIGAMATSSFHFFSMYARNALHPKGKCKGCKHHIGLQIKGTASFLHLHCRTEKDKN